MSVKHPLTIGLITVLTVALVVPLVVYAESRYDTRANSDIVAGVIGTTGSGGSYDILSGNFFTFDKNFGQDLYMFTYERARSQGSDMAVEKTLTRLNETALSTDAIHALVPGSNISQLLSTEIPGAGLDPSTFFARKQELEATLGEEKEFADLTVAMLADVEPTELFANGDESDSGFDLLVDLDVIQTILFGKSDTVFGDGNGANGARAGNVVDVIAQDPKKKPTAREKAEQKQKEQQDKKRAKAAADAAAALAAAANPKPINPADEIICPVEPSFNGAVEAALSAINDVGDTLGGAGPNGGAPGANGDRDPADADNSDADGDDEGILDDIAAANDLIPAEIASWNRELPCTKLFCLTIVPRFKTESSYVSSDNCIACHVEKINDAFAKTLKHNLVPNKVTGNLYEGPKCKKALLGLFDGGDILTFNFIPIAQPILTPPNDNLIIKGDFWKNLKDAYKKYYNNPGRCADLLSLSPNRAEQGAGGACASDGKNKDSDPTADVAKQTLGSINKGTDISSVLTTLQGEVESRTQEAQKTVEESRLNSEAQAHASQYSALMSELDTMNASFQAMKDTLLRISDPKNPDTPCSALVNKPVCE